MSWRRGRGSTGQLAFSHDRPWSTNPGQPRTRPDSLGRRATLECELLDRRSFRSQAEARMAVFHLIEGSYNPTRRHSALGYLSPIEYEARTMAKND